MIPGDRLGPYEIVAPIGAGGMGDVYRARDARLGRDVAIKVIPAQFADHPERLRRFEQEARAVAALSHPNILAIFDVGTHEAIPYLVTELLEGESLRDRLRGGGVTVRKTVEIGVQIAQGLAAAHEKGIIHRDLKPGNVFVTTNGQVKILDFGLAKLTRPEVTQDSHAVTESGEPSTESGTVLGTMGYTSPEQLRGERADARSDIFSFGCVLYEMLSGKSPFLKGTGAETVVAIMSEDPPPLSGTGRAIGPALQEIVSRCLEKRPEDRFSSAHDLAFALQAYSAGSELPVTAKAAVRRPPGRRRRLAWAAGLVLLVSVAAALLVWRPWEGKAPAASFEPSSVVVAVFENRTGDASLDTVGTQIADALTNDLLKTGELKVAVNPAATEGGGGGGGDPLLRLAQGTRSALVVAGTCDLRGAELEVQARVVDPWSGKGLYTAAPVRCPRGDPLSTLEPLRQRVTGAVVWNLDPKLMTFGKGYKPPRYDALVEYREGQADFGRDFAAADAHFVSSFALDPEFDLAWLMHLQGLDPEERVEELTILEANLGRLGPAERLTVQWLRAEVDGRIADALAAYRERATLTGTSPENFNLGIGGYEVALNHPAAAIRAFSSLPEDFGALHYSLDYMPMWRLAEAYHMNRDYKAQLKVAREGERRFPGVLQFYSQEAGALAALGRLDEIERVIQARGAVQGGVRSGWWLETMFSTTSELRAHGHREASLKVAEGIVAWCRERPPAEAADYRGEVMSALIFAERLSEAKAIADVLLAENPDDIDLRLAAGMLAARLGDAAQARRIEAELAALTTPYLYGGHTLSRACIAAQLGEEDRAVTLLRDAFGQGLQFSIHIHRELCLEPLWGYPPYEELMKPKG